jgi:AcrR family transcriptional regulator
VTELASPRRTRGPSIAKTAQTRAQIVSAATQIFLEKGYSDTRMSDVASAAEVAKGTLYLHFADKDNLFEEVVRAAIAERLEVLAASAGDSSESVRAKLRRLYSSVVFEKQNNKRHGILRIIITEGERFPALASIYRRVILEPALERIRNLLARAVAEGDLDSDALVRFPELMMAPMLMSSLWDILGIAGELDTKAMMAAHLDVIFGPEKEADK